MTATTIQWTDRVWNPVRGCSRVSEGCRNCYAERIAARFSDEGKPFHGFAVSSPEGHGARWTGNVALIPEKLDEPFHWRKPSRVFVNSMSDLFHEKLSDEEIAKVFGIMAGTLRHTFQILTKRPERMLAWTRWAEKLPLAHESKRPAYTCAVMAGVPLECVRPWPLSNVWLGVSVEDQATADERTAFLRETPAAVRFISHEPALAHVDWTGLLNGVSWLIYGGESGPGARPNDIAWARSARDQCKEAGVAFFMKQAGRWLLGDQAKFDVKDWLLADGSGFAPPIIGPHANERPANAIGFSLYDAKGGDMAEWPEDLRVREFPS